MTWGLFAFLLIPIGQPAKPSPAPLDGQDLLVVRPASKPVRIRLHLLVDDFPFRLRYRSQMSELYKRLDSDSTGVLEAGEKFGLPWPAASESVDRPTFDQLAEERAPPLSVRVLPVTNRSASGLFALLDSNQDGYIQEKELASAQRLLEARDFDDDGVLSFEELSAPSNQEAASGVLVLPLRSDGSLATLDAEKCRRMFEADFSPPQAIDVECWAPIGKSKMRLDAKLGPGVPPGSTVVHVATGSRVSIDAKSVRISLRVYSPMLSNSPAANQSTDLPSFRTLDADNNGYLNMSELKSTVPAGAFRTLDADDDGRVFYAEYNQFAALRKKVLNATLSLHVADFGQEFFDALDLNADRRLTRLELASAAATMNRARRPKSPEKQNDLPAGSVSSSDQSISGEDFPVSMEWILTVGTVVPTSPTSAPLSKSPSASVVRTETKAGDATVSSASAMPAAWFLQMDLNRDNVVDRVEFLGPISRFDAIDGDHDGLISPKESTVHPVASP